MIYLSEVRKNCYSLCSIRSWPRFDGRDLKELSHVLGMEVKRDRKAKTLPISHKQIISDLLERNNMKSCRCSPTPLVPRVKIISLSEDPTQEKAAVSEHKRFIKAVGSIQYIAAVTQPDFTYVAHTLARHWQAVQRSIG